MSHIRFHAPVDDIVVLNHEPISDSEAKSKLTEFISNSHKNNVCREVVYHLDYILEGMII